MLKNCPYFLVTCKIMSQVNTFVMKFNLEVKK